jgi:aminoglycoside phosphotransferase (APT) family kinase protein
VIEGKKTLRIKTPLAVPKFLIQSQFPQYSNLIIKPVEYNGWDNVTFHLGEKKANSFA